MGIVYVEHIHYLCLMFIKEVKKQNGPLSRIFFQYHLVQNTRIDGKVKQHIILYLGSDTELQDKANRDIVCTLLKNHFFGRADLFAEELPPELVVLADKYIALFEKKYDGISIGQVLSVPPKKDEADMEKIDINTLNIEDSRSFGGEHLCKQVLEMLTMGDILQKVGFSKPAAIEAQISIASRALFVSSEHKTAQYLKDNSGLLNLYQMDPGSITRHHLYNVTDRLYEQRASIDKLLYERIQTLFDLDDNIVIYDISNSYFEGKKTNSKLAKYGRSKEKRNDCKQVVFTGVINGDAFIRHSQIYEGNKADATTLEDMIVDLKKHTAELSKKVIVLDAAFSTTENLKYLESQQLKYVCVSRTKIKDYIIQSKESVVTITDRLGRPIELSTFQPKGYTDTWMYVKSEEKRKKEQSMADKLGKRLEEEIQSLHDGLDKKGTTKKIEKIWERVGRIKEKHSMVSGRYDIQVEQNGTLATAVTYKKKNEKKEEDEYGIYFIRTNMDTKDEATIWSCYNTIRRVESTFRCLKSELNIRPIHHQKDSRVEGHIYQTILAYQMVNTIRHMLKQHDINDDWNNIRRIMSTQTIQTITLPTETKVIKVQKPSKPTAQVLNIYTSTKTKPTLPMVKKSVVYH